VMQAELTRRINSDNYSESRNSWSLVWILASRGCEWALGKVKELTAKKQERLDALAVCGRFLSKASNLSQVLRDHLCSLSSAQYVAWIAESQNAHSSARFWVAEGVSRWREEFRRRTGSAVDSGDTLVQLTHKGDPLAKLRLIYQSVTPNSASFRINPISGPQDGWHIDWKALIANLSFSASPSRETLAKTLERIGPEAVADSTRSARLCWPMEECVRACSNNDDLRSIVSRVRDGELGDREQWEAAEARWAKDGVTPCDLVSVGQGDLPFDYGIGEKGTPLSIISLAECADVDPGSVYSLLEAHTSLSGPPRQRLANLITEVHACLRSDLDASAVANVVTEMMKAEIPCDVQTVIRQIVATRLDEIDLQFCGRVGHAKFVSMHTNNNRKEFAVEDLGRVGQNLARVLRRDPSQYGLRRLLSFLPPAWANYASVATNPVTIDDLSKASADSTADWILRVDQAQFETAEAQLLVAAIQRLRTERPELPLRFCWSMCSKEGTKPEREALLTALLQDLGHGRTHADLRGKIVQSLDDLGKRRTSIVTLNTRVPA
jgi:hypothetical protein